MQIRPVFADSVTYILEVSNCEILRHHNSRGYIYYDNENYVRTYYDYHILLQTSYVCIQNHLVMQYRISGTFGGH